MLKLLKKLGKEKKEDLILMLFYYMGTIVLSVSFLRGMFYTGRFESQLNWFEVICLDSVLLLFCCLALYWFYCRMQRLIEVRTLQEYEYEAQMGKIIKLKWLKY